MNPAAAHPDLVQHLRRLIAVVGEACAREERWGWLAAPVALLTWIRERRMRREQAAALAALQGMLGQLLAVVEDFRAGRLVAVTPDVEEPAGRATNLCGSPRLRRWTAESAEGRGGGARRGMP